jgi:hypothetical protein
MGEDAKAITAANAQIDLGVEGLAIPGTEPFQNVVRIGPSLENALTRCPDDALNN